MQRAGGGKWLCSRRKKQKTLQITISVTGCSYLEVMIICVVPYSGYTDVAFYQINQSSSICTEMFQ